MQNQLILQTLFEIHHAQLKDKRDRVHAITERTVALLALCAGWLILTDAPPTGWLRVLLVVIVAGIALMSCRLQAGHSKTYLEVAGVVRKLDDVFALFEPGRYVAGDALYPEKWGPFGTKHWLWYVLHHWLAIVGMTLVCILAAFAR